MSRMSDTRLARAGRNESVFRDVNERVADLSQLFGALQPTGEFVCECADERCTEFVVLPLAAYEAVRAHSTRFIVRPGHEVLDVETVVEEHPGYLVVEKRGVAAEVAEALDPRDGPPAAPS
jgi:hypothetical protein